MARVHAERFLNELEELCERHNVVILPDEMNEHTPILTVKQHSYEISRSFGLGAIAIINDLNEEIERENETIT